MLLWRNKKMERQIKKIFFGAFVIINNNIAYASLGDLNGLFCVDLKTNNCTYISMFPNEKAGREKLHCKAEYINNKVYFIPRSADYISIFDLDTKEISQIAIPLPVENRWSYDKGAKFADSCIYDNCLWILPATFPGVLKINIETEEITVIDNWIPNKKYCFYVNGMCKINNRLFLADTLSSAVLEIDMTLSQVKVNFAGKNNTGHSSMCSEDGINIWMTHVSGPIIKWNYKNGTYEEYSNYPKGYKHNNQNEFDFNKVYSSGNYVYFIPNRGNMMIKFDINKNEMSEINENIFNSATRCRYLFETDSFIYIIVYYDGYKKNFKISKSTNEISTGDFVFLEGENKRSREHISAEIQNEEVINESETFGLEEFMAALADEEKL